MKGYKQMIRDRVPKTWDLALKYNRCKEKWVELVYSTHISKYNTDYRVKDRNKLKSEKIKRIVQEKRNEYGSYMTFADTINLESQLWRGTPKEYANWKLIDKWVSYFKSNYAYIAAEIVSNQGKTEEEIVSIISSKYRTGDKLALFIVKNYKS